MGKVSFRLWIMMKVFMWAFKGWEYECEITPSDGEENVRSFMLKAIYPNREECQN